MNNMAKKDELIVEIDLPVYNEANCLAMSVKKLRHFLQTNNFAYSWQIVIVDNGSTDNTIEIAKELKEQYPEVDYFCLKQKGRGRALREAWFRSKADIVSYMDADLATDLGAFPLLIEAVLIDGFDIATGSRLIKGSFVKRSLKREFLSRCYILLLKCFLRISFRDAQCGFKALNRTVIENVLPKVLDQEWFFDSELLFKCQKYGYKIKEIPVHWIEGKSSKVEILKTIKNYLSSIIRLKKEI